MTLDEDSEPSGSEPKRRRQLIEAEPHRLEMIGLVGRAYITDEATRTCLNSGVD